MGADPLRDAVPKGANSLAPIFEIDATGSPCVADQLARHRGYLPAFGVFVLCGCEVLCSIGLRRRLDDVFSPCGTTGPTNR